MKKVRRKRSRNRVHELSPAAERWFVEQLKAEWEQATRAKREHEIIEKAVTIGKEATRWLLTLAAIGGALAVTAVAPNVWAAYGGGRRQFFEGPRVRPALRYLRHKRYLAYHEFGSSLRVTTKGRQWLIKNFSRRLRVDREGKKESGVRIVMFDIPRRHNQARDGFRAHLRSMGFEQLQESVFATTFACEDEVRFMANLWSISSYVIMLRADSIHRLEE